MTMTISARAMAAAAIGAALVLGASQASAATVVLKDTDTGATDILNTTGELTGGDSAVKASKTGIAFTDIANFVVNPGEELTSYSVTNLGTSLIGQITGGTAEIFQVSGMTQTAVLASLVDLTAAPVGVVSQHSDFSNSFDLGPGDYELKIVSTGYDAVKTQKAAKFSVELQGTAVPEPATWGVMLVGFGAIGASIRNTRRRRVAAIA